MISCGPRPSSGGAGESKGIMNTTLTFTAGGQMQRHFSPKVMEEPLACVRGYSRLARPQISSAEVFYPNWGRWSGKPERLPQAG